MYSTASALYSTSLVPGTSYTQCRVDSPSMSLAYDEPSSFPEQLPSKSAWKSHVMASNASLQACLPPGVFLESQKPLASLCSAASAASSSMSSSPGPSSKPCNKSKDIKTNVKVEKSNKKMDGKKQKEEEDGESVWDFAPGNDFVCSSSFSNESDSDSDASESLAYSPKLEKRQDLNRSWGTGRKKIEIKFISSKHKRQVTFSKRKSGLMKKLQELTTLTNTDALLILVSETGNAHSYATAKFQGIVDSLADFKTKKSCKTEDF